MPRRFEARNERAVVVDFAIEDDDHTAVFVPQGLLAGGKVDDGKTPMAQPHARLHVLPTLVGAAVKLQGVHPAEDSNVHGAQFTRVE